MERLTQFDPSVCGRAFVVQKFDYKEQGTLAPSLIWEQDGDRVILYGDIIDRLAYYEEMTEEPATAGQPEPMTREKILDAAKRCVCGDREQDYGTPEQNFQTIANLWEAYLRVGAVSPGADLCIRPEDVAAMLALLKIARISSGHGKADNWIDLAGYAACGGELEDGNG